MPVLSANAFDFFSHSPEQTRRLGMRLGAYLQVGDVVCLQGELGTGKTTFVQGLAAGWGTLDAVSSPTFVLVNDYRRTDGGHLYHFDTYRVESAPEAEELDLDSMLNSGSLVIEWPERLESLLPPERLWIKLAYVDEDRRELTFLPAGKRYITLLNDFRTSSFGAG
ncbi:MAG TPA: tRNA (adenosine(37)-N6)-threonylcarbamoyltransferase complex ATPase subunit type 1 TsaE [Anaerolineales bacterium]|jgi:tRNA threonylcarbamoyladenosine biosynthesis protein TsaE